MQYVSKKMGIYTLDAKRAMEIAREILENEEKQNIQIFGATPSQFDGEMGYLVSVSYYEYTDKENYERNLSKTQETIEENFSSLQEKVDDNIISKLRDTTRKQVSKINELYQKSYINEAEASNYLHDLLEIVTSIIRFLLLSYESTNVKILESDNSICISYYCSCLNIEYPIEKYIEIKDKTFNLIREVGLNLCNLNNRKKYQTINYLADKYYIIDDKLHKDEISIEEAILEMNDCYSEINSISKSNKKLELKKVEN